MSWPIIEPGTPHNTSQVGGWWFWTLVTPCKRPAPFPVRTATPTLPAICHARLTLLPWRWRHQYVGIYLPDYTVSHPRTSNLHMAGRDDGCYWMLLCSDTLVYVVCIVQGCFISGPWVISGPLHWPERGQKKEQEALGRTNRLLSLIRHGPHWKRRVQQFFYCCVCIRYCGNDRGIFTELLPSNDKGIHIQTDGRDIF
jgi:hypothetical protein